MSMSFINEVDDTRGYADRVNSLPLSVWWASSTGLRSPSDCMFCPYGAETLIVH